VTGFEEAMGFCAAIDLGEDTGPLTRIGAGLLTMTGAGTLWAGASAGMSTAEGSLTIGAGAAAGAALVEAVGSELVEVTR
jgi:hypothetical protein